MSFCISTSLLHLSVTPVWRVGSKSSGQNDQSKQWATCSPHTTKPDNPTHSGQIHVYTSHCMLRPGMVTSHLAIHGFLPVRFGRCGPCQLSWEWVFPAQVADGCGCAWEVPQLPMTGNQISSIRCLAQQKCGVHWMHLYIRNYTWGYEHNIEPVNTLWA